ncbi:leucine rich repeat protein [Biomphalaria glabrata]|nr:protein lap1-like [Biomphalaria glabrata]
MKKKPPNLHSLTQFDHLPAAKRLRIQVMKNSKGYVELNLNDRDLRLVPPETFHMTSVQVLRLANNHIDHLPLMIAYLRELKVLDMQHNLLVNLPETLANCRSLAELKLTANRLTDLPSSIGGLNSLRVLELGENQMEQLPQEVGLLSSLRILDLHGNKLWHLPVSLQGCRQLVKLDLSDNMFDHVPLVVTKMTSLKALSLAKNRLAALPVDFDCLRGLRELNLSQNKFVSISSMLLALKHLRYLTLAGNGLKFLPPHMSTLQNLRVLHLQDNELRHVPSNLLSLSYLNVSNNQLTTLSVQHMSRLISLAAAGNELEIPPRGLYKLKQLKFLYLNDNQLVELEDDIGKLRQLRVLDLSNNQLTVLPQSLFRLPRLHTFNVKGNHKLAKTGTINEPEVKPADDNHGEINGKANLKEEVNFEKVQTSILTFGSEKWFDKETKPMAGLASNDDNHFHSLKKMNGYGPDMQQETQVQPHVKGTTRSQKGMASGVPTQQKIKRKPKKFQSVRSLRDILFGKSRGTKSEHATATLRSSHSINLPIHYSKEEVETGGTEAGGHSRRQPARNQWTFDRQTGKASSRSVKDNTILTNPRDSGRYQEHDHVSRTNRMMPRPQVNRTYSHRDIGYTAEDLQHSSEGSEYESENERHRGPQDSFDVSLINRLPSTRREWEHRTQSSHTQHRANSNQRYADNRFEEKFNFSYGPRSRRSYRHPHQDVRRHRSRERRYSDDFINGNPYGNSMPISKRNRNIQKRNVDYADKMQTSYRVVDGASYSNSDGDSDDERAYWTYSDYYNDGQKEVDKYTESLNSIRIKGQYFRGQRQMFDHILSTQEDEDFSSEQDVGPETYFDENFSMKEKTKSLKRNRSLDSLLHQFNEQHASPQTFRKDKAMNFSPEHQQPGVKGDNYGTDYSLLGVCSHVENLLNNSIVQPTVRHSYSRGQSQTEKRKSQSNWSFGPKNVSRLEDRQKEGGRPEEESEDPDMDYQQPQSFTVTSTGGQFVSSGHPAVTVSIPAHAVNHSLQISLQIHPSTLHIGSFLQLVLLSQNLLEKLKHLNHFVNNILVLGPVVFIHADREISFNSQATLTIPAPPAVRGGHLVVLTIRQDNSCIPCSNAYRSEKLSATLAVWHLST